MEGKRKKYIWFDLGYTLLKLNREGKFQNILTDLGSSRTIDEIDKAFHLTDKLFMRKYPGLLGKGRDSYMPMFLGNVTYILGIRLDICPLYEEWKKKLKDPFKVWIPFDHVEDELIKLSDQGFRLGVISNWDKTAVPLLDMHGLTPLFENIIISSEVGFEKPSVEIFNIALDQAKISAEDCLYVGDNYYDDGIGSKNAGMDFVIINSFGKLGVEEIKDCAIVPDITHLKDYL